MHETIIPLIPVVAWIVIDNILDNVEFSVDMLGV